jgi:DNA-binding MarR family transcriptional regulator
VKWATDVSDDQTVRSVESLSVTLNDLHKVLRRATTRATGRPPLPEAQVEVLQLVRRVPGISVKTVAERLGTAANTVSTLVGALTEAGYLERTRDPENRRVVRLRLTAAAYERIADYAGRRSELLLGALARLDPADRAAVLAAAMPLRRLVDVLTDQEPVA